ncbi:MULTISPECIES: hypothetical protein [unclassified Streptomyces]|uniref:hypothetical protein n=1 Tax=unclassified Streptomyces TaxID=2593676 RepID=UPI00325434B5
MSGSNEPMRVDTEKLRAAERKLQELTGHVQSAAERFHADCDAYGDVIGDDKNGKKFHEQYDSAHKDAASAGFDGAKLAERTTGEVAQLIHALENVEQESAETGQRLTSETGQRPTEQKYNG